MSTNERATKDLPPVPLKDRLTLSLPEAALLTGLSLTLISEAVGAGLLRSSKLGKRRVIYRSELEKFIDKGERKPLRVRKAYRSERLRVRVAKGAGR